MGIADRTYFLPLIHPSHYEAFRALDGADLPDTYDEWFQFLAQEKLERARVGYLIQEVEINPDEFSGYCVARGIAQNSLNLLRFAEEKALRDGD